MAVDSVSSGAFPDGQTAPAGSEARLQSVLEAIVDPLLIMASVRDEHGTVVDLVYEYVNGPALANLGIPEDELLGSRLLERFPSHVELGLFDKYRAVVETGERLLVEVPWFQEGNLSGAYEVSATRLGDGLLAITRDVTERVVAARRLNESERRYRLLADHAGDVAAMTIAGVVVWVSPSVATVLGLDPSELVGRRIESLIHVDDLAIAEGFTGEHDSVGRPARTRLRVTSGAGGWKWVDVSGRRATAEDSDLDGAWVFVFWDVDAEVRALQALEAAEQERRELEERVHQAQRLDSLGVLAGGIAHDFNNLLVGVLGNADLLLRTPGLSAEDRRIALENIAEAAERAAGLTRHMLDYAGRRSVEVRPVELADVIVHTAQMASTSVVSATPVDVDVPVGLPAVLADPGRLQQVAMNLIINACQAAEATGGKVAVSASAVTLSSDDVVRWSPGGGMAPGLYVMFEVADTGTGMTPEVQKRLFEPFFTTKADGRGLGLSVVHGVIASLGGAIDVRSTTGVGTSIRVLLPAADQDATAASSASNETPLPTNHRPNRHLVLVVDDEKFVRMFIERALVACGYDVMVAVDGPQALRTLTDADVQPAVAIVDVSMPGMELPDLISRLRIACPGLGIIVTSGYGYRDIEHSVGGVKRFLQKPFRMDALRSAVEEVLAEHE